MRVKDIAEVGEIITEIKKLNLYNWDIENVNINYFNQGTINIRLVRISSTKKRKEFVNVLEMEDINPDACSTKEVINSPDRIVSANLPVAIGNAGEIGANPILDIHSQIKEELDKDYATEECPKCGGPRSYGSALCRLCWKKEGSPKQRGVHFAKDKLNATESK